MRYDRRVLGRVTPMLALALAGCTSSVSMIVELRTELRAGAEIARVETDVFRGDASPATDAPLRSAPPRALAPTEDALAGVRVAELDGLEPGTYLVRVRALDAAANHQGTALVLVALRASRVVTAILTRDCRDVTCPGDGAPTAIACLDGRCVEPTCPEDPSTCPPPECAADGECTPAGAAACVRGACLAGFCVEYPDDARCGAGRCDRVEGCVGDASDAGVDAGSDAGADAGSDAGVDAGPACSPLMGIEVNVSFSPLGPSSPTWSAVDASGMPTGQTPYFTDFVYCNREDAPYGFTLEITSHPSLPNVPSPTIWGYSGPGVTDPSDVDFVTTGLGARTPYRLLAPGDFYTLRVGGLSTGATGAVAARNTP